MNINNSISTGRRPSIVLSSEMASHRTLLRPRESQPSMAMSTSGSLMGSNGDDTWRGRAQLIFRIISFCLGPGNIWRFPQQSFTYGNGVQFFVFFSITITILPAIYIYVYLTCNWLFGISLLLFEITLSQYFIKGFAKIFTLCPIMEGITLSMVFYCIMASLLYNMICVYSFIYVFAALRDSMHHSYCSEYIKMHNCENNSANPHRSPEYTFFFYYVERATEQYGTEYNWRNMSFLAIIWIFLCITIVFGVLKYHWIAVTLSSTIFCVLLYVAIRSVFLHGASGGLSRMLIPHESDLYKLTTWIYPFEQCIVSLGVGAGPLITIWSFSNTRHWSHLDCVLANCIAFLCSLLSGIIFFSAAGVVAYTRNSTVSAYFKDDVKVSDSNVHILVTEMLNTLSPGFSNLTLFFYYAMLFISCCYSLLEYVQILLLYISSYATVKKGKRTKMIVFVCVALYLSTNIGASKVGYSIITAINKNFIATGLLIIIFFELLSVSYFYGLHNFCDDIEFMLGFFPNFYYRFTWTTLPALFGIISAVSMYQKFRDIESYYDLVVLCLIILLIIVPIIAWATYKCIVGIKETGIRRVINPRLNENNWNTVPTLNESQLSDLTRYSSLYTALYNRSGSIQHVN